MYVAEAENDSNHNERRDQLLIILLQMVHPNIAVRIYVIVVYMVLLLSTIYPHWFQVVHHSLLLVVCVCMIS
jgi:hypothetical protein